MHSHDWCTPLRQLQAMPADGAGRKNALIAAQVMAEAAYEALAFVLPPQRSGCLRLNQSEVLHQRSSGFTDARGWGRGGGACVSAKRVLHRCTEQSQSHDQVRSFRKCLFVVELLKRLQDSNSSLTAPTAHAVLGVHRKTAPPRPLAMAAQSRSAAAIHRRAALQQCPLCVTRVSQLTAV